MAIKLSNAAAIEAADAVTVLLDGGDLRLRTGAPPATGDAAATGTLLATFTFASPAFAGAVDANPHAEATAEAIANTVGVANGTAGYFEARTSGGTTVMTGTVTETGGGGDLTINDSDIVVDQVVQITSFIYRQREL